MYYHCMFLPLNEYGRRTIDRPTLFFLPHCPAVLLNNILSANWTTANLNKILILGDSFSAIKNDVTFGCKTLLFLKHLMAIIHSHKIVGEIPLPKPEILREMPHSEPEICEQSANLYERPYVYVKAFSEISWHFFPSDGSLEDLNLNLFPEFVRNSRRLDLMYLRC